MAGDANADGRVDGRDVQAFLVALGASAPPPACDLDGDGVVCHRDVPHFLGALLGVDGPVAVPDPAAATIALALKQIAQRLDELALFDELGAKSRSPA